MTQPLRSNSLSRVVITTASCSAPVPRIGTLRLARSTCLTFFLHIAATGSHVPHKSLMHGDAALIPDVAWPGNRVTAKLVSEEGVSPDFDIDQRNISIYHQRFAYARLLHLT
jgi:hypothetical protein